LCIRQTSDDRGGGRAADAQVVVVGGVEEHQIPSTMATWTPGAGAIAIGSTRRSRGTAMPPLPPVQL
jgi:hypothetical protein